MRNLLYILKDYPVKELVLSLLTKILFLLPILAIILIPTIHLLIFFVPFNLYFFIAIEIFVTIALYVCNHIFINALKSYKTLEHINYSKVKKYATLLESSIVLIVLMIIHIIIN